MKKIILLSTICALCTQAYSQSWSLTGNTGTNASTNFIGTTDNVAFKIRTKNVVRITVTGLGKMGIGITTPVWKLDVKGGSINTDSVYRIAGNTVLSAAGSFNTFVGIGSGFSNTTGNANTATGSYALCSNTTGFQNTATGNNALYSNTTGSNNTANGINTLHNNTSGTNNTANGLNALYSNSTGFFNTANGTSSAVNTSTGYYNTTNGVYSLYENTTGHSNTVNGVYALYENTTGIGNTGSGVDALYNNKTGHYNTAIGYYAGVNIGLNPSNFTAIGYNAGHVAGNSNEMEIGNTSVTWIGGQSGFFNYSDKRIKDNIQSNVPGLSFITRLNPVTYNLNIHRQNEMCGINDTNEWEGKYDIEKITQTGFLAQEVEQAASDCNYDFNGVKAPHGNAKLYSVQYASFVVPLVKAVQELAAKADAQDKIIADLTSEINNLKSNAKQPASGHPGSSILFQNTPNPFNSETEIKFQLPAQFQAARLIIIDQHGIEIKSYNIESSKPVFIKAGNLSAGIYSYTLVVDEITVDTKQMILTR